MKSNSSLIEQRYPPPKELVLPPNLIFVQSSSENEDVRQKLFNFSF